MRYFLYFLVFLLIGSNAMADVLSEEKVLAFIEKVDSSFINMDPEVLESALSDSAIIEGTTTVSGDVSEYSISKEQYLSSVVAAWRSYINYEYTKESSKIENITENEATVDEVVVETFEIDGSNYEVRSRNKVFIEREQETLKTTRVIANSTVTKT